MKKAQRILVILLALVLCFALFACNKTPATTSPTPTSAAPPSPAGKKYADSITVLGEGNIKAVDPYSTSGSGGVNRSVYSCVYDRLVCFANNKYLPELAKSWKEEGAQTFTFVLREDVKFHNGDKFTAQDVVDTFDIGKNSPGTTAFEVWRFVEKVTALSEYEVQIVLTAPNADFMYKVTTTGASIVNKRAREANAIEGAWVGTGAYTVTSYDPDYVVITRNDNYWGGVMPTRQIAFRYLPEAAARTMALRNGESEISFNIAPNDLEWFEKSPDFEVITFVANVINTIGFNMNDPITGDINFRKAVAHAIVPAEINLVASGAYGIPVTDGAVWGYGTEFKNPNIPLPEYNLDLAKEYLAKSTYDGSEVEIVSGNVDVHRGAEMIQEQLGKIGIKTKLYQTDHVSLWAHTAFSDNKAQMVHYLNVFDYSAGSARGVLHPTGVWNMVSYENARVSELLEKAPSVADPKEREKMYWEVQELVAKDMPYIGAFFSMRCITAVKGVGGIILDPDLNHVFKGVYVELKG